MSNKKAGFLVYFEPLSSQIEQITDAQLGALFRAMFNYSAYGVEPEIDDVIINVLWSTQKRALDINAEKYKDTVKKRRLAALIRWAKDKGIDADKLIAEAHAKQIDPEEYIEQYIKAQ